MTAQHHLRRCGVLLKCVNYNQGLALIMAGHAKLEIEEYRQLFARISRVLMQMIEGRWSPRTEWDCRELNIVADHAANMALDIGEDRLDEILKLSTKPNAG